MRKEKISWPALFVAFITIIAVYGLF